MKSIDSTSIYIYIDDFLFYGENAVAQNDVQFNR